MSPIERRFSTSRHSVPDIRADWLTDRVAAVESALNVLYRASAALRIQTRWVTPYRADVSVIESGRIEPRVTVQVTPRSCRLDGVEGMSRESILRSLQSVMGPDAVRVR